MKEPTTIDAAEHDKFEQHAGDWWDKQGPLKTLHDINPSRLKFVKQFIKLSDLRILDLGCGGGVFTEAIAAEGANVIGLDMVADSIAAARMHAEQSALPIEYLCQDLESYEGEPFDAIVCMEMLEHVSHPQSILHHCHRLLKKDGWLFVSTINRNGLSYAGAIIVAEYLLNLLPRQTHDYQRFIKPSELAKMLRAESFELKAIQGMHYNPLTRQAELVSDVSINYLMAAQKESC